MLSRRLIYRFVFALMLFGSPLFAAEKFKRPPMTLEDEVKQATRDYRPGKAKAP